MAIEIRLAEGGYLARVTPPHGGRPCETEQPVSMRDLEQALRDLGCHPTDIGDAFYAADPDWLNR